MMENEEEMDIKVIEDEEYKYIRYNGDEIKKIMEIEIERKGGDIEKKRKIY